ncbi:phage protein NinX family protein [Burkholderia anthina]|uniref:phage protein NinX family protein n=1 Tax=Burkholderia anthina TaxID=179879 RepID=UPI00158E36ED|nr:phage protein NinX family protein [Burkholderia anthina]
MKVSELSGVLLDYWVARAEGMSHEQASFVVPAHAYSTEWAYGGPIIEREKIATLPCFENGRFYWRAAHPYYVNASVGDTPLIAAMRAYVASKFGNEVPDAG